MRLINTELIEGIFILTLNRPSNLNALNKELFAELNQLIDQAEENNDIRCVVITGVGSKAFCAGADIEGLLGLNESQAYEYMRFGQLVFNRLEKLPKPVIAAVNGYALGGGCELAMACDIRFAAESAKFGQPEINLANLPGWGATQRLPRLVGVAKAKEIIFSGEFINANDALSIGLVNRVYLAEDLMKHTVEYAKLLSSKSQETLQIAKQLIHLGIEHGFEEGLEGEALSVAKRCQTEEQRQAVTEFLVRRSRKS